MQFVCNHYLIVPYILLNFFEYRLSFSKPPCKFLFAALNYIMVNFQFQPVIRQIAGAPGKQHKK